MINAHKSLADSLSLQAISAFYAGLAMEESIDYTAFEEPARPAADRVAAIEKFRKAAQEYKKAQELFASAARECAAYKKRFDATREEAALFDRDVKALKDLGELMGRMVGDINGGRAPAMETTHAAMTDIADIMTYGRYRAEAHRGMPGHFPKAGLAFEN